MNSRPSRQPHTLQRALVSLAAFVALPVAGSSSYDESAASDCLRVLSAALIPDAQAALARIGESPQRWLALRAYVRAGDSLPRRWSWTQQQIDDFKRSGDHQDLLDAVRQVKSRFEAANPGYTLYANTEVRSLDTQLERWNENASVAAVARALERALANEFGRVRDAAQPTEQLCTRLEKVVREWQPPRPAALAAPGLSLHGQLRAIDFAVFKQGRLIAPTTLAAVGPIWHRQGWTQKLASATAGNGFNGPLKIPDEPWHYEYSGARRAAQPTHASKGE